MGRMGSFFHKMPLSDLLLVFYFGNIQELPLEFFRVYSEKQDGRNGHLKFFFIINYAGMIIFHTWIQLKR